MKHLIRFWRPSASWRLAGLCAVLFLSGNWILPLIDRDEPRFAEASREMMEGARWVLPTFNGAPRLDKPPFIYWCQVASYCLFGENAFAARFPSAVFAFGTALLLLGFGRRVANERIAWWGAVIFATSLQTLVTARSAVADLSLVFFVTLSIRSGWELITSSDRRSPWLVFYTSLAFGFLAKGPVAWLPLGGVIWMATRGKLEPNRLVRRPILRLPSGLLLMLGLVALWGIPALVQTNGDFFRVGIGHHVVHRTFSVMEGHGARSTLGYLLTLPLLFVTFLPSFFPWSWFMIVSLRRTAWKPVRDGLDQYLWVQALLFFTVFTLSKTKLPHYTLPAFPCLALWLARSWNGEGVFPQSRRLWAGAMVLFTLVITLGAFTWVRPWFASAELMRRARPYLHRSMAFATADYDEPSLVWEFRSVLDSPLKRVPAKGAAEFMRTNASFVLIEESDAIAIREEAPDPNLIRLTVRGFDPANGKPVTLTALLSPAKQAPGLRSHRETQ